MPTPQLAYVLCIYFFWLKSIFWAFNFINIYCFYGYIGVIAPISGILAGRPPGVTPIVEPLRVTGEYGVAFEIGDPSWIPALIDIGVMVWLCSFLGRPLKLISLLLDFRGLWVAFYFIKLISLLFIFANCISLPTEEWLWVSYRVWFVWLTAVGDTGYDGAGLDPI